MNKNDSLGDRMKTYEAVSKNFLTRRIPVIIRLDGKAFHTFTKGFQKPFDMILMRAMQETMKQLCENIQGCVLGYTQSDEITLVLCDYQTITTDAWFGYNVEKMCSVAASMATLYFFKALCEYRDELWESNDCSFSDKIDLINRKLEMGAFFDARCFNVPKEEVNNCLVWRQQDAIRNSIQAVAQSCFSCKELQGLSTDKLIKKLIDEKDINWTTDFTTPCRKGCCCIKREVQFDNIIRKKWVVDRDIPTFSMQPHYVNNEIIFKDC